LILIEIPSQDARIAEILTDPDRYFADASARAWIAARAEIDADLAQRAQHRLNHHNIRSADPASWLPATTDLSSARLSGPAETSSRDART
jgi:hypothetical protein